MAGKITFKKVLGFLISVTSVIILLFKPQMIYNYHNYHNYFNFSLTNHSKITETKEVPDIFKNYLWRPKPDQVDNSLRYDRYLFQRKWAIKVAQSDYMKSVKKKKRILVKGLFNLDNMEKTLPCDEEGVNFSQYCELVEDFGLLPYVNFDNFDAVLSRRDWTYQFYEPRVPPRLISFFHIMESPYTLHQADFRPNNPILASYYRGSDIELPYYKWIPYSNNSSTKINASTIPKNYAANKHKIAAIVVSHCPTYNDRLRYVFELQKYIPVDIYGKCGPLQCGEDCLEKISAEYKFYLAFENANCRDYITEKFFLNALRNDILPVVLGAHPNDYKYAAPSPHSYIHVEDFSSVKELANYLTFLDQNDDLYNEYFTWKGTGEIVNGHTDLFCRFCAFLYYSDFHPPPKWSQDSFRWLEVNPCLKPGQHFWGNAST